MADDTNLPPLSGEIMSEDASPEVRFRAGRDAVVDAEFETLPRQQLAMPAPPVAATAGLQGMTMLRGGRQMRDTVGSGRGGAGFWIVGLGLVAAAFWFSGGHTLARQDLPAAVAVADTAIRVSSLTSRVEETAGRPQLLVDGALDNPSTQPAPPPGIVISVTAGDGTVTRYRLGKGGSPIDGGGTWRFSSRLEAPRSGVKSVSVTVDAEATR